VNDKCIKSKGVVKEPGYLWRNFKPGKEGGLRKGFGREHPGLNGLVGQNFIPQGKGLGRNQGLLLGFQELFIYGPLLGR